MTIRPCFAATSRSPWHSPRDCWMNCHRSELMAMQGDENGLGLGSIESGWAEVPHNVAPCHPAWIGRPHHEVPFAASSALAQRRLRMRIRMSALMAASSAWRSIWKAVSSARGEASSFSPFDEDEVLGTNQSSRDSAREPFGILLTAAALWTVAPLGTSHSCGPKLRDQFMIHA